MKQYWKVAIAFILSAIVYKLLENWLPGNFAWVLTLLWCVILVGLGILMSPNQKRNSRWLGKVFLAILILIIVVYKMDWINVSGFTQILNNVGFSGGFLDLLLLFSGWAFFQV